MKKLILTLVCIAIIVTAILLFVPKQNQEKEIVLAWSGISEVPVWAKDVSVTASGNSFTREFTMEFFGTAEEIENWITSDEVFKNAEKVSAVSKGEINAATGEKYVLVPQAGAGYAEVVVYREIGKVVVRVYWS